MKRRSAQEIYKLLEKQTEIHFFKGKTTKGKPYWNLSLTNPSCQFGGHTSIQEILNAALVWDKMKDMSESERSG